MHNSVHKAGLLKNNCLSNKASFIAKDRKVFSIASKNVCPLYIFVLRTAFSKKISNVVLLVNYEEGFNTCTPSLDAIIENRADVLRIIVWG